VETTSDRGNREHRRQVCRRTKKCDRCPLHDGENRGRRPKSDRGKSKRRAKR
jgi:hypothetical protein